MKFSLSDLMDYNLGPRRNEIWLTAEDSYATPDLEQEPGVEYAMASKFIKGLAWLSHALDEDETIIIHMKSGGGDWVEGLAIYDAIKAVPQRTIMVCYGQAVSMSSVLLQAADVRVMRPNAVMMIHHGGFSIDGTSRQAISSVKQLERDMDQMIDFYASRMMKRGKLKRRGKAGVRKWLREQLDAREDVYLSAKEAVAYGLADQVADGDIE